MIIPIIDAALKVLDKVLPDPAAKAAAQLEVLKLQQSGEFKSLEADLQMAQMQADTNKIEAANPSMFVSGWRPAIGWVCGLAFFAQFIGQPLLAWVSPVLHLPAPPPVPDYSSLMPVLLGMLGLGGMRTFEKLKGVTK